MSTKNTKNTKNKSGDGKMIAATAAGAAAVGAGVYYLFGPNGKANQKKAKALVSKIKNDVKREVKKAKEISVPMYNKAVDVITENYREQYKLHEKDIKAIAQKLKSEWREVTKKPKPKPKPKAKRKPTKKKV
jgi:hypothetical protein